MQVFVTETPLMPKGTALPVMGIFLAAALTAVGLVSCQERWSPKPVPVPVNPHPSVPTRASDWSGVDKRKVCDGTPAKEQQSKEVS